ncbi:MAG: molybdenum cofactor biosynthesis protein MoaE [Granulosicoccus sp.]|nr:molybdenum cofactor biosynthesis protein MoaE [Granulosicoccus sp.]
MKIEIRAKPFDPWQELADYQCSLKAGSFGATAVFVGTMRDFNEGDSVTSMLLEHYPGMTEKQLESLAEDSIAQHGLDDVLILHRVGEVMPSDPIVLVAAWSAHRKAAFDSSREMMEKLKSVATFWKKEQLEHDSRWVEKNTAG